MIPLNKMSIKSKKIRQSKTNVPLENIFPSFSNIPNMNSFNNIPNTRYIQSNNPNIYNRDIKEIDIKNIPNEILYKNKTKTNRHQRNKNHKNFIPYKTTSSYSIENISDNSFPKYQNNTYTQRTIETYEIPLGRNYCFNQQIWHGIKNRENNSMDITYYKPIIYINKNENNNSFCKKSENSEYFTQNNSFFMNGTNIEDNIGNINLNNTINYNKEKYYKQKNIITSVNHIPKPQKFKKKIPPIPIKKINESNNNSFYFEENELNNNININNTSNINTKKIKNGFSSEKNKLDSTNLNTNTNKKGKNTNQKYSNKTYSLGYIKNIEKIGIQLSFSNNKIKNESIDLISPEILKNLKQYSSEKPDRDIVYSDLNMNKIKEFNSNEKNWNSKTFNVNKNYATMRQKYGKLSFYLLKNKKRRTSQKITKKEKYNIVDIKEKIKEEKKNRSLSNLFKYKKKEIIRESPSATNIKKQNDIGGKIDLKIQSIKNKRYNIKIGIKRRAILTNLIKQCTITKSTKDQGEIIINAAKTIQKWWRDLISKIFIILNIIKIQSIYRSYITRKKIHQRKNINNTLTSKKIKNFIYRKIISKSQAMNNTSKHTSNIRKSRNTKNLENIISSNSFKIGSNEDIHASIKKEEEEPILIIDKKNMKLSFYTKENYRNIGERNIIFIQKYIKNYLNSIDKYRNIKPIKYPLIPLSFIEKTRYQNIINKNPIITRPIINICTFTKNNIYLKKKKPVIYSISKMNFESISTKKEQMQNLICEIPNRALNIKEDRTFQNNLAIIEKIYQIPLLNNFCFIDKIYVNNNEVNEKIKILQKKYKNLINQRKKETQQIFKRNINSISFLTKEFKDDSINSNKISLIQNKFRNCIKKRKEKNNELLLDIKYNQDSQKYEIFNNIIDNLMKKYYLNYSMNQLRKLIKLQKQKYFLKMLIQRIKKIINQFSYQNLKLNYSKIINQKNRINNKQNINDIEIINSNDDILLPLNNDSDNFDKIFFFDTIKRHIKINELDNNLSSDNEINKLLKENIPDYFNNYPKMNYIPYIEENNEENLINKQLYSFDDEKLAEYIHKCYQIEKNIKTITPDIIKKRLILEPIKYQNLFTITRYMDNLCDDYIKNNICKNCYCKNNEFCLSGCKYHNMNNLIFLNKNHKDDKIINNDNLNENLNINLTINEELNTQDNKELSNKKNRRFSDDNTYNSNITDIKKSNTFTKYKNSTENNEKDNYEKNSINTEYNKNNNNRRINNFIRNFALRKKLRNSTISNLSNISNQNEETINININLNNHLNDKSLTIDYFDQSNIYEDDILLENSNKKINTSLLKKKMKTIEPIPNHIRNLMIKASNFRNIRKESRKKQKETIKLRDSFVNLDYEYYDNI